MKYVSLLLLVFWLPSGLWANSLPDQLCKQTEEVILSFVVEKDKKTVSICKEKTGKYLVYRFGTRDKIDMEFPESLDESSWKKFSLYAEVIPAIDGKESGFYELIFNSPKYSYSIYENRNGATVDFSIEVRDIAQEVNNGALVTIFSSEAKMANGSLKQLIAEKHTHNRPLNVITQQDPEELVSNRVTKPALVKTKKWKAITFYQTDYPKGKESWEKITSYSFSPTGNVVKQEEPDDEDDYSRGSWRQEFETIYFDAKGRFSEEKHFESGPESDSIFIYSNVYGYNDKGQMITESHKDAGGKVTLTKTIRYDGRGNDIEYIDHFNKRRWTRSYDPYSRPLTIKDFRNLNELVKVDSFVYSKPDNQIIWERYEKQLNNDKMETTGYSKFISDSNGKFINGSTEYYSNGKLHTASGSKQIWNNNGLLEQKESYNQTDFKTQTRTKYFYNEKHEVIKEITYSGQETISGKKWVYAYY